MEKVTKKPGVKPGTKFTTEHKRNISIARRGLATGEQNGNYKKDRTRIKVGVTSFSVTADVADWLKSQPNKTEYILTLIREDMKKRTNK